MGNRKQDIITLKVDSSFLEAMKGIPNRSEYIRSAVLSALKNTCPMCAGTGNLTPNQKTHWDSFAGSHYLDECTDCHELRIVCEKETPRPAEGTKRPSRGKKT